MSGMTLDLGPELLISVEQLSHIMRTMITMNNIKEEHPELIYNDPVVSNNDVTMTQPIETARKLLHEK